MLELHLPSGVDWFPWFASQAAQTFGLLLTATLAFDVVHYFLHRAAKSRWTLLRRVGALHDTHHDFFDRQLRFVDPLSTRNLREHVIPEFLTRIVVAMAGLVIFSPIAVAIVLGIQAIQLIAVVRGRGRDSNHIAFETLRAPKSALIVGPRYHALHHVYPDAYYSSFVTFFDKVFGTGVSFAGRRVALTGASGAFGSALKPLLEGEGASVRTLKFGTDYTYDDYSKLDEVLADTDILVLSHGAKKDFAMQANCDSFVAIVERFVTLHKQRRIAPEIWAVGSEIEFHPAWGNADLQIYLDSKRAFAKHAYRYYRDDRFIYRHICPAGFNSRMGWAPMSARTAATIALFFIRRGFQYVPVTYTGFALLNYFKFLFNRGEKQRSVSRGTKLAA